MNKSVYGRCRRCGIQMDALVISHVGDLCGTCQWFFGRTRRAVIDLLHKLKVKI